MHPSPHEVRLFAVKQSLNCHNLLQIKDWGFNFKGMKFRGHIQTLPEVNNVAQTMPILGKDVLQKKQKMKLDVVV